MQMNPTIQNAGKVAWTGTAARTIDISKHVAFGFSFEVIAAIAADVVFEVLAHEPSLADPCAAGPGVAIDEVAICKAPAVGAKAQFVIPAGTPIGSVCGGTIPCRSGSFLTLSPVSGTTASVLAVAVLHGPILS